MNYPEDSSRADLVNLDWGIHTTGSECMDGDDVLVEWEGFVNTESYMWESVSNLQNDLGIDVFTDFLDAFPQVEVEGTRDLQEVQGVQAEVTADVAEGNGATPFEQA